MSWRHHESCLINTLRPRQYGCHFADDIFKCIFLNENVSFSIKISLNFVPKGRINNIYALVQIMAWHRRGDKSLSEPMMVSLLTHICVTRPQWVKLSYKANVFNLKNTITQMNMFMRTANKRRCYNITLSLIGCAHTQNNPCHHRNSPFLWYFPSELIGYVRT